MKIQLKKKLKTFERTKKKIALRMLEKWFNKNEKQKKWISALAIKKIFEKARIANINR